jgi:hypothetical protein
MRWEGRDLRVRALLPFCVFEEEAVYRRTESAPF